MECVCFGLFRIKAFIMITLFSTLKPVRGHFGIIQTNALQSWLHLHPACEIVLFGNEEGTGEISSRLGARHIPRVACNKWGTPLISSLFEEAQKVANNQILCYVNADIILMSDFLDAVQRVRKRAFLIVGRRWNLKVDELVNFDDPNWEHGLRDDVAIHGVLEKPDGLDYFVFPKGIFSDIPSFAVGRPGWDNWMIYRARYLGIPVIDVTPSMPAIHQIHDYSHHPQGKEGVWKGPEAEANLQLLGGARYAFTLWDATSRLYPNGLRLALTRTHLERRLETLAVLYPKRILRNMSLKILISGLLNLYDLFVRHRVSRAALAIARKLLAFVTTKIK